MEMTLRCKGNTIENLSKGTCFRIISGLSPSYQSLFCVSWEEISEDIL
jgi:hypothetical protein